MRLLLFITSLLCCFKLSAQCSFTFSATSPGCYGECTGYIHALPSGTAPFTYNWSTGDSTNIIDSLCAGNYVLTLTDSTGCTFVDSIELIEANPLLIDAVIMTPPTNVGGNDGSAQVIVSGGTAPYFATFGLCDSAFLGPWVTVPELHPFNMLSAGSYHFLVTDANGCTDTSNCITIPDLPADSCSITYNSTNVVCHGDCNGFAQVIAGGTPPISYTWSTGDTLSVLPNICAGLYYVTIEDSIGCIKSEVFQIYEPTPINPDVSISIYLSAPGACDAQLNVFALGGTPPYIFSEIMNCQDSTVFTFTPFMNLCAGEYAIIMQDDNMCMDTSVCITINDPVLNVSKNENTITFTWHDRFLHFDEPVKDLTLFDMQGKFVTSIKTEVQHVLFPDIIAPGAYIIHYKSLDGRLFRERLVIQP